MICVCLEYFQFLAFGPRHARLTSAKNTNGNTVSECRSVAVLECVHISRVVVLVVRALPCAADATVLLLFVRRILCIRYVHQRPFLSITPSRLIPDYKDLLSLFLDALEKTRLKDWNCTPTGIRTQIHGVRVRYTCHLCYRGLFNF